MVKMDRHRDAQARRLGAGDPSVTEELHGTNTGIQSFEYMMYDALHPGH